MNSSSRAPPPPPLNIAGSNDKAAAYTMSRSYTDDYNNTRSPLHNRKESSSSTATWSSTSSAGFSSPSPQYSSKKATSPTANVYTYCGRHTDQYLFGGWSDMAKGIFKKH